MKSALFVFAGVLLATATGVQADPYPTVRCGNTRTQITLVQSCAIRDEPDAQTFCSAVVANRYIAGMGRTLAAATKGNRATASRCEFRH